MIKYKDHTRGACHLVIDHAWNDCDCIDIDPSDRPCASCLGLEDSAANGCQTCNEHQIKRKTELAYFCSLPPQIQKLVRESRASVLEHNYQKNGPAFVPGQRRQQLPSIDNYITRKLAEIIQEAERSNLKDKHELLTKLRQYMKDGLE